MEYLIIRAGAFIRARSGNWHDKWVRWNECEDENLITESASLKDARCSHHLMDDWRKLSPRSIACYRWSALTTFSCTHSLHTTFPTGACSENWFWFMLHVFFLQRYPGNVAIWVAFLINVHTHTHSRSGLTMPLSRHSVGTYQETSSHATRQGTLGHSRLSSLSHFGLILALIVELVCAS